MNNKVSHNRIEGITIIVSIIVHTEQDIEKEIYI